SPAFADAVVSGTMSRAKHVFQLDRHEVGRVRFAAQSIAERIRNTRDTLRTLKDFRRFVDTRGNDIVLTAPRLVKIQDAKADLSQLFAELVESPVGSAEAPAPISAIPAPILSAFEQLRRTGRLRTPGKVMVPILGRVLDVPYGYQNGTL